MSDFYFEATDMIVRVDVSHIPEIKAGDHIVVREASAAEPGKLVVAKNEKGYTLARTPLGDGFEVTGRVVGVLRSLD